MKVIPVKTAKPYDVCVGSGYLNRSGSMAAQRLGICRAAVIADDCTGRLYGDTVRNSFENAGFSVSFFAFPHGEQQKNMDTLTRILEWLAEEKITCSDLIVALGGGVVGDIAGFAASIYRRGIRFMQIPTTLLAAVDAAVGGKTAVNLTAGKNLAGAFWQPSLVLFDCDTLHSLPEPFFADGISEAIKYGMVFDESLFQVLAGGHIHENLESVIDRCIQWKADVVQQDERDQGLRQKLNFGHTFGHAIEQLSGYSIPHGHAIAMGMALITKSWERLGRATSPCFKRLVATLRIYDLPIVCPYDGKSLAAAILSDKKRQGGMINLIVPNKIGECVPYPTAIPDLPNIIENGLFSETEL